MSLVEENKATMAQISAHYRHQYAVSSTRSFTCFEMTLAAGRLSANSNGSAGMITILLFTRPSTRSLCDSHS